jgi:hypothetical protein
VSRPRGAILRGTGVIVLNFLSRAIPVSDLYIYLVLLRDHWLTFMSAGPFLADRLITWFWPWGRRKLDNLPQRRQIFVWLIVLGVFWSGFSAWREEKTAREAAEQTRDSALRQVSIKPDRHLKDGQKEALSKRIREISSDQLHNIVVASVDDPEAMNYAIEFIYFFKYYEIPVYETYADPPDNRMLIPHSVKEFGRLTGISISIHDRDHPPESAKAFREAMYSVGFSVDYETFYGRIPGVGDTTQTASDFMLTIRYN